jgi:hypothetical protein
MHVPFPLRTFAFPGAKNKDSLWTGWALPLPVKLNTIQIILNGRQIGGHPESTIIPMGPEPPASGAGKQCSSCLLKWMISTGIGLSPGIRCHPGGAGDGRKGMLRPGSQAAIVAGYEVGIRIALGVGLSHYRYWHTTATCGTFAAAAGAVRVLGGDEDRFVWALGSAGTQAAGLWEFLNESAMSKPLHIGKAAMNGVLAALLAEKGLTGARKILEGEKGFFRATSQDFDEKKSLEGLGRNLWNRLLEIYASCPTMHPAIDAVLHASG